MYRSDDGAVEILRREDGTEHAVFMGSDLDVVRTRTERKGREMTNKQKEVRLEIYRRLASMLPLEGRDYVFSVEFEGDSPSPSISFSPKSELGRMWCGYAASEFKKMSTNQRKEQQNG